MPSASTVQPSGMYLRRTWAECRRGLSHREWELTGWGLKEPRTSCTKATSWGCGKSRGLEGKRVVWEWFKLQI